MKGYKQNCTLKEAFDFRTVKGDGCWAWKGTIDGNGYGVLKRGNKRLAAHRVSYELHVGEIPEGMEVCHTCDNPICVRPDHLWIGTHLENMRDRDRKGRLTPPRLFGERNPAAKITARQADEIRAVYESDGLTMKEVGKRYGVSQSNV